MTNNEQKDILFFCLIGSIVRPVGDALFRKIR